MSLKDRLLRYLTKKQHWIASGDLQRLVTEKTTYTAQNTGRRLRELQNEGEIEVKYVKGHAWYKLAEKTHTARFTGVSCDAKGDCGLCHLFAKETDYVR